MNIETDINYKALNFSQYGFKLIKKEWVRTTVYNFGDNLERFYNLCIELYCINTNYKTIYDMNTQLDNLVYINGHKFTPDLLVKDKLNNIIGYIDFKCSLYDVTAANKNIIEADTKRKYGENVELVFLHITYNFERYLHLQAQKILFRTLYLEILDVKSRLPKKDILKYFKDESVTPDLNEILNKHPKIQEIKDEELKHEEYKTLEEMIPKILENIEDMEKFVNHHFLASEDMADYLPKVNDPTVFQKSPWNRDQNRSTYNNNKKGKGIVLNWGHKATILYQLIPNNLVLDMELSEILPYIHKLCPKTDLANLLIDTIIIQTTCKNELQTIKDLLNTKAFVKTEISVGDAQKLAMKLNTNVKNLETTISSLIEIEINKIQTKSNRNIKLSKHGYPVVQLTASTKDKLGVGKGSRKNEKYKDKILYEHTLSYENSERVKEKEARKKEGITALEDGDWFEKNFETQDGLSYLNSIFKIKYHEIPNTMNAYPFNPSFNDHSNEISTIAQSALKQCLHSRAFSSIYSYIQFYRAIVMASPRIATKGKVMEEGVITKHPDGYYIFVTPSPKEITSGSIVLFGKIRNDIRYPEWCTPINKIELLNGNTYFISEPFRVNLKIAIATDSMLGSYLGVYLLNHSLNIDTNNNYLFTSLWWAFSRQLVLATDYIYLYYKNVYNVGNFGKYEISKKFDKLSIRDVRVSTILNRIRRGYRKFVFEFKATIDNRTWEGVDDPIFKYPHTGWQSYLTICYLKQIYPKDDGYDSPALMGGFFRDCMTFRQWYEESDFNETSVDHKKSMSLEYFFSKLFTNDSKTEWTKMSYSPDMCYRMCEKLVKEAQVKNPTMSPYKSWNQLGIKTGKASKCNIPEEQHVLYDVQEKFEETAKEKSKYKGIISSDLTEALALESKAFKRHVEDKFLMAPDSAWFGFDYKLGDRIPTLIELTLFEAYIYPSAVILTMVDKHQSGYDKRGFFVQLIFNRNANKVWDESFRPILASNKWDMILTPGMEKYIDFIADMKRVNSKLWHMKVSKDATKFGETYLISTLILQIIACKDTGFFSKNEAKMLIYFAKCLTDRIVLMPWQNATTYQREANKEYITDRERKWVLEMNKFSSYLTEPMRFKGFTTQHLMNRVKENPSFRNPVGFTLGVFNISGSMYTTAYTDLIAEIEKHVGIKNLFASKTHSDDAHDATNVLCPDRSIFGEMVVAPIIKHLLKHNAMFDTSGGSFSYRGETWADTKLVKQEIIAKFHLILTLFTSRFFSQRPSLLKWGFGVANEVLQIVQFNSQVHVPLVRYSAALGKDLPGKSPGSDTYMMTGRFYDLLVNGGTTDLIASTILATNFMVSDMFGIPNDKRLINHPPEIGGIWWSIPARIFEEGFNSNEVRLQCFTDNYTKRILLFLINTHEVWGKEKKENSAKDLFVMESLSLDNENQEITGGIEYRKDFRLKLNRVKKTSLGLSKLLDAFKDEVNISYDEVKQKTKSFKDEGYLPLNEKLVRLKDQWVVETSAGSLSMVQNIVNIASKYTTSSRQESYVRLSPDVRLVSKLGYFKHKFSIPFNPAITEFLKVNMNFQSDIIQTGEVWNAIIFLATSDYAVPNINYKGVSLVKGILTSFIADTMNIVLSSNYIEENVFTDNLNVEYKKINDKRELMGIGTYSVKALAAIYQMGQTKNLTLRETFVVRSNPDLAENKIFAEQVNIVKGFLNEHNYTTLDILHHYRLLSMLLSEKHFHGVAKIPSNEFSFEVVTGLFWKFNKHRVYQATYRNTDKLIETSDIDRRQRLKEPTDYRFDRAVLAVGWGNTIFGGTIPLDGKFILHDYIFDIPDPIYLIHQLEIKEFSNFLSNQILSSIIWHNIHKRVNCEISRTILKYGNNQKDHIITFKIDTIPLIMLRRYEYILGSFTWEIYAENFNIQESGRFFYNMGKLLTYWLIGKKKRITSLEHIINRDPKLKTTNYTVFEDKIVYKDNRPENWKYLAIRDWIPKAFSNLPYINYGEIKPYGIIFTYDHAKKNNNYNNLYLCTPWNLGFNTSNIMYVNDKNETLIQDNNTFLTCMNHSTYLTFKCYHDSSFPEFLDHYVIINLEVINDIISTIYNFLEIEQQINLKLEDYSEVVGSIREVEIYLGIPFSIMYYLGNTYPIESKRKINFKGKMKLYLQSLSTQCPIPYSDLSIPERLRYLGYVIVCTYGFHVSEDLIRDRFLQTINDEIGPNLTWTLDDEIFETLPNLLDLDKRWGKPGNLPISVFSILCSSIPALYKLASFVRKQNYILYRNIGIDEIYFINSLKCVDDEKIILFKDFINMV